MCSIQTAWRREQNTQIVAVEKKQVKALARASGLSRMRKFESLDGNIDYFDYSDDTKSD